MMEDEGCLIIDGIPIQQSDFSLEEKRVKQRMSNRKSYLKHIDKRRKEKLDYYYANHEKARESRRNWKLNNPGYAREYNWESRYGITAEQYSEMLVTQHGCCAICGANSPSNGRYKKYFSVDHDHQTHKIRQLLCHQCNLGLGGFKDNPVLLRAAADYIERHKNNAETILKDGEYHETCD